MNQKLNIFDFDGTIAETNLLKSDAFSFAAKQFGSDIEKWFVKYHKENGGVTRQEKIRKLCQKVGNEDIYSHCLGLYEEYLAEHWLTCPLVRGVRSYLEGLDSVNIILSGGAKVEIEDYLAANGLSPYFEEVYGNPVDKVVNLEAIKSKYIHHNTDILFYGDSKLDFELASSINAEFIFVKGVSEWVSVADYQDQFSLTVNDFVGLENKVQQCNLTTTLK